MAHIILVEDDTLLRNNLRRYLLGLGHDVYTAANGEEGMAAVDRMTPDLIITDINMPEMDGIALLNKLRHRGFLFPVVVISGGGQFDKKLLLRSAAVLGAHRILEKPFPLDALGQMLSGLLDRPTSLDP